MALDERLAATSKQPSGSDAPILGLGETKGRSAIPPKEGAVYPRTLAGRIIVALVFFGLGLGIGFILFSNEQGTLIAQHADPISMSNCQDKTLKLLDLKAPPSTTLLQELLSYCYSAIRSEGILDDFVARKMTFTQQYRANGVLLWMVVAITISGVVLAGLQLAASYKLAEANRLGSLTTSDEISVKRDQLVLKSSVTGLFILLISFAFFLVFVFYVYRIESPPEANSFAQQRVTLPEGGLGPPPTSPKQ